MQNPDIQEEHAYTIHPGQYIVLCLGILGLRFLFGDHISLGVAIENNNRKRPTKKKTLLQYQKE